jgi:ribonuclease HI
MINTMMISITKKSPLTSRLKSQNTDAKVYPISPHIMNFDGCSKGNPGLAGIGAVIYKDKEEIWCGSKFIGVKTNNYSEYSALIFGLQQAIQMGIEHLNVLGDSLLVINQVNGVYKVKADDLRELHEEAVNLKKQFKYIEFNHVYRENNKRADALSNIALDGDHVLESTFQKEDTVEEKVLEDDLENVLEDGFTLEKLEEIIVKRPSKRISKVQATTINSFFPVITFSKSTVKK